MKGLLVIVVFLLFICSSCQKNNGTNEITASWKLTEILDKTTNTMIYPPAGSNMDIVITFLGQDKFAGHTLRNTLTDGSYKQTGNQIMFGSFSMTKIGEDPWGQKFLSVLMACSLQPTSNCVPSSISIQGNSMKIASSVDYDLTLEKL